MRRLVALLLLLAGGCAPGPRELVAGQDACEFCRMEITDTRFGGAVHLSTGRTQTFDAVECLASFLSTLPDSSTIRTVLVSDYGAKRLIPAASAQFVRSGRVRSPMGRELVAIGPSAVATDYGGTVMTWAEVRALIAREGLAPKHAHAPQPPT